MSSAEELEIAEARINNARQALLDYVPSKGIARPGTKSPPGGSRDEGASGFLKGEFGSG